MRSVLGIMCHNELVASENADINRNCKIISRDANFEENCNGKFQLS